MVFIFTVIYVNLHPIYDQYLANIWTYMANIWAYLAIIFYDFGRGLAADLIFSCVRAAGGASLAHMKKLHWGA